MGMASCAHWIPYPLPSLAATTSKAQKDAHGDSPHLHRHSKVSRVILLLSPVHPMSTEQNYK
jgi:hypothetical protein